MPGRIIPIPKECLICGESFDAKFMIHKYCSQKCNSTAKQELRKQRYRTKREKIKLSCIMCGVSLPSTARRDKKFCSEECAGAARFNTSRADRRLRIDVDGEIKTITRLAIYERDNWICQLCNEPIDRNLRYPDRNCASLDHVIPLSKGGVNSAENFQASHLICNTSIGNKKTESQLRPAPIWNGIEYCSLSQATKELGLDMGRVRNLVNAGTIPSLPRKKKGDNYRIPISFIEDIQVTGIPPEFLIDKRLKPDKKPEATHRELECQFCKKTVSVSIDLKSGRKFCSDRCYKDSKNQRRRKLEPTVAKDGSKTCVICGKDNPIKRNTWRSKICGRDECLKEYGHIKRVKDRELNKPRPLCKHCNKEFKFRERGSGAPLKYCSAECRQAHKSVMNKELALKKKSE